MLSAAEFVRVDIEQKNYAFESGVRATEPGGGLPTRAPGALSGELIGFATRCEAGRAESEACADTKPTVPTVVATTRETVSILNAVIMKLPWLNELSNCRKAANTTL